MYDAKRIAQDFSKAASCYDSLAALQWQVAGRLAKDIDALAHSGDMLIDLGAGSGFVMRQSTADAEWVALDLAYGMLQSAPGGMMAVVGDMQLLPFRSELADMLVSSLAFQWLTAPEIMLAEAHRVLKPGGKLLAATFIPPTLGEFEQCWQQALPGRPSPVNEFIDLSGWLKLFQAQGFQPSHHRVETIHEHYPSLRALATHLQNIGAGNKKLGQRQPLSRQSWQHLEDTADVIIRSEKGLLTSWHVLYLTANKR